jgi:uncharacterized protein (DUF58 family)
VTEPPRPPRNAAGGAVAAAFWRTVREAIRERLRGPWFRVIPEPRLALVVAFLSPLWLLPNGLARIAAFGALGVVALVVAVEWFSLPGARDLSLEREIPASVGIGDNVTLTYVVASHWRLPLRMTLFDDLPGALKGGAVELTFDLPPRGEGRVDATVTGMLRGRFALGSIALRVRTRLGLLTARFLWSPGDTILVTPSVAQVRRFRLLALQHRLHEAGVRALRLRGEGRSFAGLRDYVLGDDPRFVDWKATARRNKLMTREFTIEQSQTVITLIDSGRSMTQLAGAYSRFEHALSAALVLTDVAAGSGDRVGTLVFDDEVRAFVAPQRGQAALRAVRNALVPVTATVTEPDFAGAFRHLALHQRRRALIVFFTDVIDVRASKALVAHVSRSAARHLVVVVALRNDALFAAATPRSNTELAIYEGAAAEELLIGRDEALERMRRVGVTVLDVSPERMAAAVVNRYLDIKARGAL